MPSTKIILIQLTQFYIWVILEIIKYMYHIFKIIIIVNNILKFMLFKDILKMAICFLAIWVGLLSISNNKQKIHICLFYISKNF